MLVHQSLDPHPLIYAVKRDLRCEAKNRERGKGSNLAGSIVNPFRGANPLCPDEEFEAGA